ncbi:MAG: putative DNA binding domain-containing protein [Dysgonamonadaceae bacterium]|jgi:ATP-dependent DNA helicase RecG|nr:putative DNA binding domain-containing protein [Dysgonamonadaceae bacterium]
MTIQEIKRLRETEDKVEFKEAKRDFSFAGGNHADPRERRKCVLGYVVALANEGGGYLVFGVREKKELPHEIVGTAFAEGETGKLEDEIYKRLSIRVEIEELYDDGKRVLVFKIPVRPVGSPLNFEGVPLMRIGDSLHAMSNDELFRILSEREPDFSATICEGLTFEDLDAEAIAVMKERYAIKQKNPAFKTLPDMQILSDLELTEKDKFNYAALLLLGTRKALRKHLPNAAVTVEYRLNHSMIPYTARKEFQEPLFTAIDKIWAYIDQPASNPLLHIQNKFNIYDIKSFNEIVIREAVINSCVHRSYAFSDDVFIKQYPDEIIITNAGGFPPGVSKENILTVNSRPRSKRLTEVLQKTGFIERSGQGVDKMFSLCIMESKPLPDYSNTDATQVDLRLKAKIIDGSFYLFLNKVQSERKEELNVFELLTLNNIRQGISTGLHEASVEKLQREGLIKSLSSADRKYVLSDLYYEFAQQPAYIKEYRVSDLQTVAGCFEKAKEVYMKDFVVAFNNQLSREQVRHLIAKLEQGKLLTVIKAQKYTRYTLNGDVINPNENISSQFIEILSK